VEPTIAVLSPELASRIAAGEVVERPASVAKELIENALDAGATRIEVTVEGGGIGLIEVADDGRGMAPEDARLSIERHATSKLRRFSDLDELGSYGFRGEALPSIASVSRFTLRTRTADSDEALELITEGASEPRVRPAAGPVGTTVRVADLFYNVPARRKFLRSTGTEAGHVGDVVLDAALCRPDVAFTLVRDGRQVRSWSRARDREERVRQLLGEEELIECRGERGPLTVLALLSRPERARQGATGLKVLVNGRPVRDRGLAGTIAHAYGSVLERGRYPRGVVYLELPQRLVDVNVHPQKTEVRFADPRAVSDAVHGIVARELGRELSGAPALRRPGTPAVLSGPSMPRQLPEDDRPELWRRKRPPQVVPLLVQDSAHAGIRGGPPAPGVSPPSASPASPRTSPLELRHPAALRPTNTSTDVASTDVASTDVAQADVASAVLTAADVTDRTSPALTPPPAPARTSDQHARTAWKRLRFLAQVRETYLICEGAEGLYVLDQHAAAERVVFSKLRAQYLARNVAAQTLLFPVTVEVTPTESDVLAHHGEQIAALGLDVRVRTPEAVSIHAVPKLLQSGSPERMLRDLLVELTRAGERAFSDAVDKALATMACHAAVRAGDPLGVSEAAALLAALDEADFAAYCPHGRPIVTFTSWEELERKVGRR